MLDVHGVLAAREGDLGVRHPIASAKSSGRNGVPRLRQATARLATARSATRPPRAGEWIVPYAAGRDPSFASASPVTRKIDQPSISFAPRLS